MLGKCVSELLLPPPACAARGTASGNSGCCRGASAIPAANPDLLLRQWRAHPVRTDNMQQIMPLKQPRPAPPGRNRNIKRAHPEYWNAPAGGPTGGGVREGWSGPLSSFRRTVSGNMTSFRADPASANDVHRTWRMAHDTRRSGPKHQILQPWPMRGDDDAVDAILRCIVNNRVPGVAFDHFYHNFRVLV